MEKKIEKGQPKQKYFESEEFRGETEECSKYNKTGLEKVMMSM